MKKISIAFCVVASVLLIAACRTSHNSKVEPSSVQYITQPNAMDTSKTSNNGGLVITSEGFKWSEDQNALPFEDVIKKVPFKIKEPKIPFEVTHKGAGIINAPFDFIQLIYANDKVGYQLVLAESNSKSNTTPNGKIGPKLNDDTQTWIQSDQNVSGLYWRKDGLTFTLLSNKIEDGKFVPHYDISELTEIANSVK